MIKKRRTRFQYKKKVILLETVFLAYREEISNSVKTGLCPHLKFSLLISPCSSWEIVTKSSSIYLKHFSCNLKRIHKQLISSLVKIVFAWIWAMRISSVSISVLIFIVIFKTFRYVLQPSSGLSHCIQ